MDVRKMSMGSNQRRAPESRDDLVDLVDHEGPAERDRRLREDWDARFVAHMAAACGVPTGLREDMYALFQAQALQLQALMAACEARRAGHEVVTRDQQSR